MPQRLQEDLTFHSRRLHPLVTKRPNFQYDISDIEGTKSKPKDVPARPRNTNPLQPVYKLPSYPQPVYPVPKFVRNAMDVSDIAERKVR